MPNRRSTLAFDFDKRFPHLPSAPIVEAVIQWRARADRQWKADDLRDELLKRLPEFPESRPQHQFTFEAEFGDSDTARHERTVRWVGFRLESIDKRYISQFNRDGVTFSRLEPYNDWISFSKEARRHWHVFRELASPTEVQRLGVRFINRIELVELSNLDTILTQPPKCLHQLDLPVSGFLYQSTHEVPEYPFCINVSRTVQPASPPQRDGYGLILDIDVYTTRALECDDAEIDRHLAMMRSLKNMVFFSLLKEDALKPFKRAKND